MPDPTRCPECQQPTHAEDVFCTACGAPLARVEWSLTGDGRPTPGAISVRRGGHCVLTARNRGQAAARVEVDLSTSRGLILEGGESRRVPPGQVQEFRLNHDPTAPLSGTLRARSEDARRDEWWERQAWRIKEVSLPQVLVIREERWVLGAGALVFPASVEAQTLRLWNDADVDRTLSLTAPAGYRLRLGGNPLPETLRVGAGESVALTLSPTGEGGVVDTEWTVIPEFPPLPLLRLSPPAREPGPDLVVGIDLGNRHLRILARWRRTLVSAQPAGSVAVIAEAVPALLVLDRSSGKAYWGPEAEEHLLSGSLTQEEAVITGLLSAMASGEEPWAEQNPEWTTARLLGRHLEQAVRLVTAYLGTADPTHPLGLAGLRLQWNLTVPTSLWEDPTARERFQSAALSALAHAGVAAHDLRFLDAATAAVAGALHASKAALVAPGDAVAVLDAGTEYRAGLGHVEFPEGLPLWRPLAHGALPLPATGPAGDASAAFHALGLPVPAGLGGEALDRVLAYQIGTHADRLFQRTGAAVPTNLWKDPARPAQSPEEARVRAWRALGLARRLKERLVSETPPHQGPVFPDRPDLKGLRITHAHYAAAVVDPTLAPALRELAAQQPGGVKVQWVLLVGATHTDSAVRAHSARLFPGAKELELTETTRQQAAVLGALWEGEPLGATAPFSLSLRLPDQELPLLSHGDLLTTGRTPRFHTLTLPPNHTQQVELVASGGTLPEPLSLARWWRRNEGAHPEEVTLRFGLDSAHSLLLSLQDQGQWREQARVALARAAERQP